MLEEKLCQIGLTANEAKVYLEMLRIGPQGASVIAKRSALNRTTTYSILKELARKGIVGVVVEGRCKLFQANDPNALVGYLDRQAKTYDYFKGEILAIIPQIREITGRYNFKGPVAKYYDGIAGVKYVTKDALGAKLALGVIATDTPKMHSFIEEIYDLKDPTTKILYVRPEIDAGFFDSAINIFGDKVAIIHLGKGEEYALLIESHEVAMTHRAIFELACQSPTILRKSKHGNSGNL